MNLHGIVSAAIGSVNPFVPATVQLSAGFTTNPDFSRVPTYQNIIIDVQVQALQYNDLVHLDGLNIQGVRRAIYTNGFVAGIVRVDSKGGDLITFPHGTLPEGDIWLCAFVLEQWPDWCKIAVTLQNGS